MTISIDSNKRHPKKQAIADLGCSSGPNTFFVISEIIKLVEKICRELNHESHEYQVFMNDLPENDFNNIFKTLGSFKEKLNKEMEGRIGPCFFTGVPGSFYGRIFPTKTLHFVHSNYSLMWLSQVPDGIENNKGNIYMASMSPLNVLKAYHQQFQRDFSLFLKCRAEEFVEEGCMVLTFLGRKSDDRYSKECCFIWELMATALNDMVSEIDSVYDNKKLWRSPSKCMKAVAEPLLVNHFGEAIIEEVFGRYQEILYDRMSKEKTKFINVSISMTRKA